MLWRSGRIITSLGAILIESYVALRSPDVGGQTGKIEFRPRRGTVQCSVFGHVVQGLSRMTVSESGPSAVRFSYPIIVDCILVIQFEATAVCAMDSWNPPAQKGSRSLRTLKKLP